MAILLVTTVESGKQNSHTKQTVLLPLTVEWACACVYICVCVCVCVYIYIYIQYIYIYICTVYKHTRARFVLLFCFPDSKVVTNNMAVILIGDESSSRKRTPIIKKLFLTISLNIKLEYLTLIRGSIRFHSCPDPTVVTIWRYRASYRTLNLKRSISLQTGLS
jgi:hypothetical protein